jgi:hypothetical protein
MEHFIKVRSHGKALIATAVGEVNEAVYLLMRQEIVESIKTCDAKHILIDIRNAIVHASVMEIYQFTESSLEMFPLGFRYAIVYSEKTMSDEDAIFGETVARNRGAQVQVFRDVSKAKKWLAISEIEYE